MKTNAPPFSFKRAHRDVGICIHLLFFSRIFSRILETNKRNHLSEYRWVIREEEIARLCEKIAEVLRDRRERKNLSKNALAQKAGISVQTVAFIEGAVNSPSISTLLRICHALETTPEKIIGEARKKK